MSVLHGAQGREGCNPYGIFLKLPLHRNNYNNTRISINRIKNDNTTRNPHYYTEENHTKQHQTNENHAKSHDIT